MRVATPLGEERGKEEGLVFLSISVLRAPRVCFELRETGGLLWGFSRFCMLLLKASYCISFCLSLPTYEWG